MEILAAYDLTESYRDAAKLAGCDHHTVARYVAAREAGQLTTAPVRAGADGRPVSGQGGGVGRGEPRQGAGRRGAAASWRRWGTRARSGRRGGRWPRRRRRSGPGTGGGFRPWVPEPGLWLQWDYGDGPLVAERKSWLFCAWLAWSRYRVVLPIRDKTLPTVLACLDTTLRAFGGVPTYGLTDNEKTVTVEHVARIAVRTPTMVAAARPLRADGSRPACRPTRSPRAARRRRCGSPRPTWCRPRRTCGRPTRASPSWSEACAAFVRRGQRAARTG